jgi:hypothetical protein
MQHAVEPELVRAVDPQVGRQGNVQWLGEVLRGERRS